MSTRKGEFISLREIIEEVGVDAARFFFLMRQISAHLEFDLEIAKKQTSENPVYYVQYAHARVYSINRKAKEAGMAKWEEKKFDLLDKPEEIDLIKAIGNFSDILVACAQMFDPAPLVQYMQELATTFHRFYDQHRVIDAEQPDLSAQRLGLTNATRIVLANGFHLLGITAPEKM